MDHDPIRSRPDAHRSRRPRSPRRRSTGPVLVGVLVITALLATVVILRLREAPTEPDRPRAAPTIVIVLDELPLASLLDATGDVDDDLFPNFARLRDSSHWFRQTTTFSAYTWTAIPAMLTGVTPEPDVFPDRESVPDNLLVRAAGRLPVHISESATDMAGSRADRDDRPAIGSHDSTAQFDRFLADLDRTPEGLHYLHVLVPHTPYRYLPDGTDYLGADPEIGREDGIWSAEEPIVELARKRQLLQVQYADALIGRLIDQLVDRDLWTESQLVITSDHGYGFEPGRPVRGVDPTDPDDERPLAQILWIPLFVKERGQEDGEISDRPVRILDIAPTIAELIGLDPPDPIEGRSVLSGGSGDPDRAVLHLNTVTEGPEGAPLVVVGPTRSIERESGWRIVREDSAGAFAPPGGATGTDRILRVGPRPDLYGNPLPASAVPVAHGGFLEGDGRDDGVDGDGADGDDPDAPVGPTSPPFFRAAVPGLEVGAPVAFVVDGTVRATTRVHRGPSGPEVAAIIPPAAFASPGDEPTVHALR